jgi:hypothetical protein
MITSAFYPFKFFGTLMVPLVKINGNVAARGWITDVPGRRKHGLPEFPLPPSLPLPYTSKDERVLKRFSVTVHHPSSQQNPLPSCRDLLFL